MTERETTDLDVTGADVPHLSVPSLDDALGSVPGDAADRIDPLADGLDVARVEHEIEGWGGSMPPNELTPEQAEHLQDRPEPIGGGETGRALHGDNGNADPTWQADAPQTREPDTSLGHGGRHARED